MDKNELALYKQAKETQVPLKLFLDNGIGITSPIVDYDDSAVIVKDEDGEDMCLSFSSICSVRF